MDPDPLDDFGHGTHCAGIIAAVSNNNLGIAGLAQVRVMAEKVLDSSGGGYWDWIANGIINATDCGADIISMSLGGYGESELLHEAVRYAYDAGVLVIAAAGNDNTNMKLYPAGYDEVIAVAATDQNDNKASFSNWGDWIELAAPGVQIYSTMPTYHVTLNDWGYAMNYDYLNGTSMACPHVAGVAALVWSRYPSKTRDWVRQWLRYTADDLGDPGFDVYYGYGRINARNAVEQTPPAHELIAYEWRTPPYVKPGASGIINATILNFGESNETDVTVQLLANGTIVDSTVTGFLAGGNLATVSLTWNPTVEGLYNVTLYVVPVPGETSVENNVLWKYIYVGFLVKAVVLHSAGNIYGDIITNWQVLNSEWHLFGSTMVYIDYTTLNKEDITYEDITATEADVLIISCAYDPYAGWQFTDSEIEAITQYVHEGHGLIATAGTLYYGVPNNNKLAPLFGLNETIMWTSTGTDLLHLQNTTHPIFANVPNPLVFPQVATVLPYDGRWDSNELAGGKYLALGHYQESAIVTYRGLVYISPWLEVIPPYYHHHLQLLYNAITWSRYQKSQHELAVSMEAPKRLNPGEPTLLNATVFNRGRSNETGVELQLFIDGALVDSVTITELLVDSSYTLSHLWTPTVEGIYNVTAYALPVPGEDNIQNNVKSARVTVSTLLVALFQNYDSWGYPSNEEALDRYGVPYVVFSSSDFGRVNLTAFKKVIIASDQDQAFYNGMDAYRWWFEEYVSNGGILEIHAAAWGWHGGGWVGLLPGGLELANYYSDYVTIVDYTHSVVTTPNSITDTELDYWSSSVHGYFYMYPADSHIVIIEDSTQQPVYLEFSYGAGFVVASSQTLEWGYKNRYSRILENSLLYMPVKYEHDLAVTLEAPVIVEPSSSAVLNATVRNIGLNSEAGVELQLLINGTIVDSVVLLELPVGESYEISHLWTPTVEGTYNVTAYAPPVPDEGTTENNVATKIVSVRPIKYVLFDQTHGTDSIGSYSTWVTSLTERGYVVETHDFGPITPIVLQRYDVFVIPQAHSSYSADELSAIQNFVFNGGGFLVIGDDNPWIYTELTSFAGIAWESGGTSGITTDITPHPVTTGVASVYLSAPIAIMHVTGTAQDLVRDPACNIMLAVSEHLSGKVLGFADEDSLWDYGIGQADNLLLANNMIDWLAIPIRYEHDLAVTLDAPKFFELGNSTVLHATVINRGLNNETDVELYLLANSTVVGSAAIAELRVGESYTINCAWTPTSIGSYNITAYTPPVPREEYVANNVVTKKVNVFFYTRLYLPHDWIGDGDPMGWHADDTSWQYTLPFDFPFYGSYYKTIYISSNGLITFLGPDSSWGNSMPSLAQKLAIAPAWDDWVTYDPYDIYIWENSTHIGIRWYVRAFGSSIVANFETILSAEGVIRFNYEYNDGYVSSTVGISNGAGHILAEDLTDLNCINTIVFAPFKCDVAIYNVTASPNQAYVGQPVNINATVANEGGMPETFNVKVCYGNATYEPHPANAIWIKPSFKDLTHYAIGQKFNVEVWLNLTVASCAWQICLIYDKTILNAGRCGYTAGTTSQFFEGLPTVPVEPLFGDVNETDAYILYGECLVGLIEREPGYGSLCWVEFEIVNRPPEPYRDYLELGTFIHETFVLDPEDNEIPITRYHCVYGFGISPPTPPPSLIGEQEVYLLPGSNTTLTFIWNTTGISFGNYTISAFAEPVPGEIDIEDNTFVDGVVEILWQHDVALIDVSPSQTWVYQSRTVKFNVTVTNKGDFIEDVTIILYYNISAGETIGNETIDNLLLNENRTVTLVWVTTGVIPCRNYTITAVASIAYLDADPTDNTLADGKVKVRILGDINGDGKVDIRDIGSVAKAFGSFGSDLYPGSPPRPNWNPNCDMNGDNKIDIRDIAAAVRNFGKTCLP
jgi:hypothetical protein